ncbi:MAG: hypothetical protein H7831_03800 [Magnetococcus sp. WYHC-3]
MLVIRLLLALGAAVSVGALVLFLVTGNRDYLRLLSRTLLAGLFLALVAGVLLVAGRLLGMAL